MSHAERIIGLPGLKVERVKRKQGIQVWAKPLKRPHCYHCSHEQLTIKATYERTVKHTRQGNQVMTLHLRVPKYYCSHCHRVLKALGLERRGVNSRFSNAAACYVLITPCAYTLYLYIYYCRLEHYHACALFQQNHT